MNWKKAGLIFVPDGTVTWSKTHAQVPVIDLENQNKVWRIYYSTRTSENKSLTTFIEVEAGNPFNIVYKHDSPILQLGQLGTFDEDGIMPSCILTKGDLKYLYYIGWSQKKHVPYQNSIGLAISYDGGITFEKYSDGPIIGITHIDPFFTGTIFVFPENDFYRGYYLSCVGWTIVNGRPESKYVLKYAKSKDGINWDRQNEIVIPLKNNEEGGIVSASVIRINDKYKMWFGFRKYFDFRDNPINSYRIGYAESDDGIHWLRDDSESGIDVSESGWDSEMISYPYVIEFKSRLYLFYNGNQFGKSGFGFATLN